MCVYQSPNVAMSFLTVKRMFQFWRLPEGSFVKSDISEYGFGDAVLHLNQAVLFMLLLDGVTNWFSKHRSRIISPKEIEKCSTLILAMFHLWMIPRRVLGNAEVLCVMSEGNFGEFLTTFWSNVVIFPIHKPYVLFNNEHGTRSYRAVRN